MPRRSSTIFSRLTCAVCGTWSQISLSHSPTITSPSRIVTTSTHTSRQNSIESLTGLNNAELKSNAISALTSLYDARHETSCLISPNIVIEHDAIDDCPIDLTSWSASLSTMPDLDLDILEAATDELQQKVWLRSSINGLPNGRRKESVDVMTFDSDGFLVSLIGEWRSMSRRGSMDANSEMDE